MNLKYYLRGIGIGVILTAIIMGFALGGRKATISDAQVIERAKELGMTEGGVLTASSGEANNDAASYASSSVKALDEAGEEIFEKVDETVAYASESVSEVVEEKEKTEVKKTEEKAVAESASESSTKDNKPVSDLAAVKSGVRPATDSAEASSTLISTTDIEEDAASEAVSAPEVKDTNTENANIDNTNQDYATQNTDGVSLNTETKTVTIPSGLGSDGVAIVLYNEGVIDNATVFNKYLVENGKDRLIRSGTKVIPANATYAEIAAIITK
ncbi:hypothetical protein SAMN04487928_102169 [Butyrivibrio proteoclasticus]|uniref:YceG-like family protein n=1 Tax=Butyrivibrio proteoclasticus TaxID=43305 RepID=A0A1I5QK31_9FIRM|nr:hypothetical protein [Butyrivibrio proteoclasticus]SFP46603.1 hypothetical protein SAMN04487928_102169 [Butyrivibrio proteoclasticus]